ncbi:phosphate/phosphite/phosphonate ABC transporter substrate-binding protein [Sandaracinus amylolyticus]|uniref:Phosphonate ABC transporter phosphate-binding periplasmic component n=1 Tax=Sandaracinus amylolyticus TaxID=927083 RepID=A0A0F6YKV2_9BACT|nr:PhnD/SsuA/transferrin family substrate-binding protein [Sandaracinus amylolyticus]AKF07660.1 Phosphonate ABC transporter phosphate-binding periplasmic component [Sandaracinus amylolyticus]
MTTLVLAVGPIALDAEGERVRAGLAAALGRALQIEVEVRPALTYRELLGWVGRREVQLAWLGPALFVQAHARFGVEPLVRMEREGRASFRGALFVREDAGITTPEQLAGKRVAWVDPDSCAGFLFPRIALAQRGLDPDRLFADMRILGSHGAVVAAVASRQVDAGATFVEHASPDDPTTPIARAGWSGADVPMRAVLTSDPIPGDVIAATRVLDERWRARIVDVLESLDREPDGATAMRSLFQAARLVRATSDDYAPVRDALRAAGVKI